MIHKINIRHYLQGLLLLLSANIYAQENIITAGFQYKPIFPSQFFNKGSEITQNNINFSVQPTYGFCGGMSIRRGFTPLISVESGINYVKRRYQLSIIDGSFKGTSEFTIVGYEIPFLGLIFIRLGEKVFMDAGLGASLDMFPSSVIYTSDTYYSHFSYRKNWILAGLLANLGYEFRTEKNGYFYLGASYHLPFTDIYNTSIKYEGNNNIETIKTKLQGSYLTLDLRYFFHAEAIKKSKQ